jgi:hypothetical protein
MSFLRKALPPAPPPPTRTPKPRSEPKSPRATQRLPHGGTPTRAPAPRGIERPLGMVKVPILRQAAMPLGDHPVIDAALLCKDGKVYAFKQTWLTTHRDCYLVVPWKKRAEQFENRLIMPVEQIVRQLEVHEIRTQEEVTQ